MSYPTYENQYHKDIVVGDKTIHLTIGKFSEQVSAAVLAQCGETVVHTTVALGRKVNLGYFPLSVEFAEKLYASGIIKGSRWVKREGRPTDDAILRARVVDRTMRPLFPEGITNEVQIISTVLSYDGENEPDMLALLTSGLALQISDIPFDGPVAGMRIGYSKAANEGSDKPSFIFNPTKTEMKESDLDLIVSASKTSIVMVEAGANEVSEEVMIEALVESQELLAGVCEEIESIAAEIGKEKVTLLDEVPEDEAKAEEALIAEIKAKYDQEVHEMVVKKAHLQETGIDGLIEKISEELNADKTEEDEEISASAINNILQALMKKEARRMILEDGIRPDGRSTEQIRPIWSEVDVLPRVHGSAMFKRGATQGVTVATLADPSLGQLIEDLDGERTKNYIHHYNMPPYASGEAGRFGSPKRREIGHGALAERALLPMIPSQEEFPYTIRVVTEIMSSNGSTSQAAVCGSTLSLMAAGVPIKRPVAGIAMGLMSDGEGKFVVLSDIQGLEDHVGDMDFKVAGTEEGITAIQMDIKLKGIPKDILIKALGQARTGRLHIMSEMLKAIDAPRTELSQYAPKVHQVNIPAEKIGAVIGSGGSVIKDIIEKSGAEVNVEEDKENALGIINISSPDQESIDKAAQMIEDITREVVVGDEFEGTVTRVEGYGIFVEYLPGREGLVHVSNMAVDFVKDANELYKIGDSVHVRVKEFNPEGKIALTMLTAEQEAEQKAKRDARPPRDNNSGDRKSFDRNSRGSRNNRRSVDFGRAPRNRR
jgi:polyribonucleotide nucleotidyltransferase